MPRVKSARKVKINIPATSEEALQQHLLFKKAQGLREITLIGHKDVIRIFFKRYPQAYNPADLKNSLYSFMGENIKPATYNIRRNYLKQFFNWCISEGIYTDNPMDALKKRKDEGRVINLDVETLSKLIALPNISSYAGLRDHALFLLTLDTGIRPKEAFYLLTDDINYRAQEIYIRSEVSKTKISRTLPISPVTVQSIKD